MTTREFYKEWSKTTRIYMPEDIEPLVLVEEMMQFAEAYHQERVKLGLLDVMQQRELLIGYSKLILGDNYEAFEEFELKKIDEYLANL